MSKLKPKKSRESSRNSVEKNKESRKSLVPSAFHNLFHILELVGTPNPCQYNLRPDALSSVMSKESSQQVTSPEDGSWG